MLLRNFDSFDVITIDLPFSDNPNQSKRRPALVLSRKEFNEKNSCVIAAMITTAKKTKWLSDISVSVVEEAGLTQGCFVRFKVFSVEMSAIREKIGTLHRIDQQNIRNALKNVLNL